MKSWRENNTLDRYKEDYAQDKKEFDYLRNRNAAKQDRRSDLLAAQKDELKACFDKLCNVLDDLFEPFGFYTKASSKYYHNDDAIDLCFNKDGNEYVLRSFDIYHTFRTRLFDDRPKYDVFRDEVLRDVVSRVMDNIRHDKDKYYPTMEEEFVDFEDGIAKLKKLAKDFAEKVKPIFEEAERITDKESKIFVSDQDRNQKLYTARNRARKSYLEENPIAPGMVVIWNLQNGDVEDVEVISVNDADKTAKVKTDGGAVRKVPLDRLEVDTVRPGIDEKYW